MAKKKPKTKKTKRSLFSKEKKIKEQPVKGNGGKSSNETASHDEPAKKEFPVTPVQDVIPIKEIYRGVIVTTDGRYIKILEVLPINFTLKSYEEQDNIIHLFASWLRIAPSSMQFKIITRRADSSNIIQNIEDASEKETQPKCRELIEDHIKFIERLSGTEALQRRFFLIFEYENTSIRKKTIDDIADDVEETCRKVRGGLGACGNEVIIPTDEDYFMAEILYLFYNRKTCIEEPLDSRIIRVTKDYMAMHGLVEGEDPYPDVPIIDYLAPRGIDFTHKNFMIWDGQYVAMYYIESAGYPSQVHGGWVSSLFEAGDGVDVDIILRKLNRAQVKDKVALKLKLNRIKASGRNDTDTDFEEIEGAIYSAQYIKQALANGEDFYNLYTIITVSADTYEDLQRRQEDIMDYLYSRDITVKEIHMRLEDAFQVSAPLLQNRQDLLQFAERNVMTFGAASFFPFSSAEICDEHGIVLGVNRRYSSVVNMDIFNSKKYKNANIAILGTTGAGKTYTELLMAMRFRYQGIQVFIITPDKAHEIQRVCNHLDGSYITISPGAKSCINVMEIRPVVNPIAEYLDEQDSYEQRSWLTQKASQLLTFFHILIPDLTNEEEQLVDEAIIKTYNEFGITHKNDSVYIPGTKKLKTMPIIGDLYEVLRQNDDTHRVANILGRFVTGSASSFNHQTNVDLNNKFIVFDLEDLQGTMKAVGMFVCMDYLWTRIKENRTEKKAILIDEGWQLIGASSDVRAADFVYRIFKIIRGYGGSAIFATQDISDLFAFQDGKYGKAIISNSKTKIVLGLESQEAKAVQEVLQLTKNEVRNITNFNRGEGLICANNNKVPVFIRASEMEDELITTDPQQVKAIVERRKAEKEREEAEERRKAATFSAVQSAQREVSSRDGDVGDEQTSDFGADNSVPVQQGNTETFEKEQVQNAMDAKMLSQAMDQLSDSVIVRNPDGSIDKYDDGPALVKMDQDNFDEEVEAFDDIPSSVKHNEVPAQKQDNPAKQSRKNDQFLAGAPADEANEEIKSEEEEGPFRYGNHPPAQF